MIFTQRELQPLKYVFVSEMVCRKRNKDAGEVFSFVADLGLGNDLLCIATYIPDYTRVETG
jgi:hypothetical protein